MSMSGVTADIDFSFSTHSIESFAWQMEFCNKQILPGVLRIIAVLN